MYGSVPSSSSGRLYLLTPTNELRIAVQAVGHEIHDVFLGSLIHKRLHRVASLEQMCIPISNVLQLRALKDQVPLIPQTGYRTCYYLKPYCHLWKE